MKWIQSDYKLSEENIFRRNPATILTDEIDVFYVVTYPSDVSVLEDIVFGADIFAFNNQLRGGLQPKEVYGFFKEEDEAVKQAKKLLEERDKQAK